MTVYGGTCPQCGLPHYPHCNPPERTAAIKVIVRRIMEDHAETFKKLAKE